MSTNHNKEHTAIDEIATKMGEVIANRAKLILENLTEDEQRKLFREDQPTRTAKIICIAAAEAEYDSTLYMQFASESVVKEIRSVRRLAKLRQL